VNPQGAADLLLTADVIAYDYPFAGLSMTVDLLVQYRLSAALGGRPLWESRIPATGTAGTTEAFVGGTRLCMANERAVRSNLEQLLEQLSAVALPASAPAGAR
jgi:hypothetical protein